MYHNFCTIQFYKAAEKPTENADGPIDNGTDITKKRYNVP
jgi:hypothetical protein